ncbi:MAG: TIGR00296 family protein [Conexivisphaera sp.]
MSHEDYSLDEGRYLVALARRSMETYLRERRAIGVPDDAPERLRVSRGAFVTLRTYPEGELRGCIGRPYPAQPLLEAVVESAIDAAVNDPRFEPMSAEEADRVTVEVSVLTEPRDLKYRSPLELKELVKVGRDGLIVIWSMGSGLLLPQVPVEEKWDVEEYLSYACMKAGAPPDCWLSMRPRIQAFQAVVFEETAPRGEVVKRSLELA